MSVRRNLSVVFALFRIRFSRQTFDPVSFWAAFFIDSTVFLMQAAVFATIYLNVDTINGWDANRTIFFVGTFTLVDGLYMLLYFFGILELPQTINTGGLDLYLVKPCDALLHASFSRVNPGSIFLTIPAAILIFTSAMRLDVQVNAVSIVSYTAAVALMLILMFDLMLLMRLPAFAFKRFTGMDAAEGALVEFAFRMPPSALSGGLRFVFSVVLPYALIAGFPSAVFFGAAGAADWMLAIGVTGFFTVFSRGLWNLGLRYYDGSGSR
jgi:ABC-2 type transport system permease protein